MVGSAAVGRFRRNAQAHRRARRHDGRRRCRTTLQTKNAHEMVPPSHVLDGFGSFIAPPSTARPVPADFSGSATAEHPPGFYGPPESLLAVNTLAAADRLAPLDFSPLVNASREIYRTSEPQDLRGPIFLAALALALARYDRRAVPRRRHCSGSYRAASRAATASAIVIAALALTLGHAGAQQAMPSPERAAIGARNQTRLCRHRQCRRRCDQQGRPCRA